jgi:hypothetical protein
VKVMTAPKLTFPQEQAMERLRAGRPIDYGLSGRSAYGGLVATIRVLVRLGLIDGDLRLTEAGRAWLDANPAT